MASGSTEHFKGFIFGRPPLVVFVTCLGFFALILMSLAYYVKLNEVKNPNISQDWNVFLSNFAALEFCILNNGTDFNVGTTAAPFTTKAVPENSPSTTTEASSPLLDDLVKNYSVAMHVTIHPTKEFVSIPHNLTFLSVSITGDQIGLTGLAGEEQINVTMTLPVEWNTTQCNSLRCQSVQLYSCVYFQAARNVFPISQSPQACEQVNDTGIEYHTKLAAQNPVVNMIQPYYCKSKPVVKVEYKLDPKLTVYLSLHDRSVINLHLMHTSYFLFVMVVTILLYAVIRGKPLATKWTHDQQQLLSHTDA